MLMFTSVQLCAKRKQALLNGDSTVTCPGMSPSQIILTENTKQNQKHDMGLTPQCSLRGTTKNPLTGTWGFLLSTPVCGP